MKLFLLLFLMVFSQAQAQPDGKCGRNYANNTYRTLKQMKIKDKTMHCTLSCDLTNKCNANVSLALGIGKEFVDVLGPGDAEWGDLSANLKGVRIAVRRQAKTFRQCLSLCAGLYEIK
jgi:hypothetical protein